MRISEQKILLRQLRQGRQGAGDSLQGIVGEFLALIFPIDDALGVAEDVTFVVDDGGVLAEFADAGQIGGVLVFLSEHGGYPLSFSFSFLSIIQQIRGNFKPFLKKSRKNMQSFSSCRKRWE